MHRIVICVFFICDLFGCASNSGTGEVSSGMAGAAAVAQTAAKDQAVLHVRGMSCPLCANNIDKQLLRVPGVTRVKVNLGTGEVIVSVSSSSPPSSEQLTHAIQQSGFTLDRIDMPSDVEEE